LKERDQEESKEISHERERNWNSPRPHWSTSISPSTSHLRIRNNSLRASSSLTHLGDSNGHRDASRVSTKLQSALPKVNSSSTTSTALSHKSGDRPDSGLDEGAIGTTQSPQLKGSSPGKTPGAASNFGWNFARSPLPPLELDDPADRRGSTSSPTPGSRPSSGAPEANISSQIPVRSRNKSFGHVTSDMSLTHVVGDESSFQQDYQNGLSDVVELHSRGEPEPPAVRNSWSQEDMLLGVSLSTFTHWIGYDSILGSDEESIVDLPSQSTTPKSHPPNPIPEEIETDTETEVLTSPSPQGSPQLGAPASIPSEAPVLKVNDPPRSQTPKLLPEERGTPPGTPPSASPGSQLPTSEMSPSFALVTPPRRTSFGSSILDFRTPSPPHDLPDLPAPPSSSDDDALGGTPIQDRRVDANSNFTLTKTPKPPGAWAATPLPPKFDHRHRSSSPAAFFPLESTPPAYTSTPLPRANSYPHTRADTETDDSGEDGLLTPVATLSRARSLPLRTPAPPGAWVATPGQSALLSNGTDQSQYGSLGRRKGLLKVRFDVAESEASATEGHSNSPLSAIRLTNPELPFPKPTTDHGTDNSIEVVVNEVPQSMPKLTIPYRPTTPEQPTTPISRDNGRSPSQRSLRKSPAVRLVDAYGRERVDEAGTATSLTDLPNGHADAERKTITSQLTPRRSLVRIVDAMGREVGDTLEIPDASEGRASRSFEADVSVVSDDIPIGHAEALARMRKTLRDLAESLSDTDRLVVFYVR
jgi:serine/arginine repetitive matrix protein 2